VNERIDSGCLYIRVGVKVKFCIEFSIRIPPLGRPGLQEMDYWIHSGRGDIRILAQVVDRVKMWAYCFRIAINIGRDGSEHVTKLFSQSQHSAFSQVMLIGGLVTGGWA
jgi:hypothetical protein